MSCAYIHIVGLGIYAITHHIQILKHQPASVRKMVASTTHIASTGPETSQVSEKARYSSKCVSSSFSLSNRSRANGSLDGGPLAAWTYKVSALLDQVEQALYRVLGRDRCDTLHFGFNLSSREKELRQEVTLSVTV